MQVDEGVHEDIDDAQESLIRILKVLQVKNLHTDHTVLRHHPKKP